MKLEFTLEDGRKVVLPRWSGTIQQATALVVMSYGSPVARVKSTPVA